MSDERTAVVSRCEEETFAISRIADVMFGLLKFINPTIAGWFNVQIQRSHLPHSAILMGKIGES